jgi:hypothetical protein
MFKMLFPQLTSPKSVNSNDKAIVRNEETSVEVSKNLTVIQYMRTEYLAGIN